MDVIPHTVREFGVEARKAGKSWEAAFNGPIQSWTDRQRADLTYGVTVRLSRLKDPVTRELYSTNLLFYLPGERDAGDAQCLRNGAAISLHPHSRPAHAGPALSRRVQGKCGTMPTRKASSWRTCA